MPTLIEGRDGSSILGSVGDDVLAGDVIIDTTSAIETLVASVGDADGPIDGVDGEFQRFDLDGLVARNALPAISVGNGGITVGEAAGNGGDNAILLAFNDTISGDGGNDTIAGDVIAQEGQGAYLSVAVANGGSISGNYYYPGDDVTDTSGAAASRTTVIASSDELRGGNGNDLIIGDVRGAWAGLAAAVGNGGNLSRIGYNSGEDEGPAGGADNRLVAFNDRAFGGEGNDVLIGDAETTAFHGRLSLSVGMGGTGFVSRGNIGGGDNNLIDAFNDTLHGGFGSDSVVGDVSSTNGGGVTIQLDAGLGSTHFRDRFLPGSDGGSGNQVSACNDICVGAAGDDLLIGDVSIAGEGTAALSLSISRGGFASPFTDAGSGGDANSFDTFSDRLSGGAGEDQIIGDLRQIGRTVDIKMSAEVAEGGLGATANQVHAFDDTLLGGGSSDWLIGDVLVEGYGVGSAAQGRLSIEARAGNSFDGGGEGGGRGGNGNQLTVANDIIRSGDELDTLVGDISAKLSDAGIILSTLVGEGGNGLYTEDRYGPRGAGAGGSENIARTFSDILSSGDGDDSVVGDVDLAQAHCSVLVLAAAGCGGSTYGGNGGSFNQSHISGDVLSGGAGSDRLVGDIRAVSAHVDVAVELTAGLGGYVQSRLGRERGPNGDGGSGNTLVAHEDQFFGGIGSDFLIGAILIELSTAKIELKASAGDGGAHGVELFCWRAWWGRQLHQSPR